jgi:hypothetical protein
MFWDISLSRWTVHHRKQIKVTNDQAMQTWRLQVVFEVSAVHFKADGSTSHKHSIEPELLLMQSIAVTAARGFATKSLITLLENESICSFKCPYVGKPIGSRYGNREVHAHGLPRPINVPGFITFSHYQIDTFLAVCRSSIVPKIPLPQSWRQILKHSS